MHTRPWSRSLVACSAALMLLGACDGDGGTRPVSDVVEANDTTPSDTTTPTDTALPPGDGLALVRLDPAKGSTAGLEEVQLFGRGFTHVTSVEFGAVPAAELFAVSDELLVVLTPPRPAGLVDVTVVDDQGARATLDLAFTFRDDVQVTLVEPAKGNVRGGDTVTISGAGFTDDATVIIGGRAAPIVHVASDASLTAVTPPGAPGEAELFVTTRWGVARYKPGFFFDDVPHIDVVAPSVGPLTGGIPVVISGTGFAPPLTVRFGSAVVRDATVDASGRISLVAPAHAAAGPVDVAVTSEAGTALAAGAFHYLAADDAAFALRAAYPARGGVAGGDRVTLVVTGLSGEPVEVRFGGVPATVVSQDPAAGVVVALSPAAERAQTVGLSVRQGGVQRDLPAAFTYLAGPVITGVEPAEGPAAGGTRLTIRGTGFKAGVSVRVGALPATNVRVVNATTLEATTGPGSPGPAAVSVTVGGAGHTLGGAFTYRGLPAVWVVAPPTGAVAGGTRVRIYGHGFTTGGGTPQVLFGQSAATEVTVLDDDTISARTPRGSAGVVPVVVRTASWDARHPSGFVYFDPATYPGSWGEPIDGDLNVTVVDAQSGLRVGGAAVVVGPSVSTTLRGFANDAGQITFSRAELVGEQTVTASRAGYQTMQIAGFDAANVTLALAPVPTCADMADIPCDQLTEPGKVAFFTGRVTGSTKGPTIPWGECADWTDAGASLCRACAADSDCDAGHRCGELPGQGFFCTADCAADADCGRGFRCVDTSGAGGPGQCVPPPGETKVYCDVTEADMYATDQIPYPGVEVQGDNTVTFTTHLGNYAVYCWRGVLARNFFRPQVMGVTRHLGAFEDGQRVEAEIRLDIPLRRKAAIVVDKPIMAPPGQEAIVMRTLLNLHGDGVAELPPLRSITETRFSEILPELTGVIADASWDFFVSVDVESLNGNSSTIEPGIINVANDLDLALGEDGWERRKTFETTTRGVAPIGEDLLAVGDGGRVTRSFGPNHWAYQDAGTTRDLYAVAVRSESQAVAVGAAGVATFWDGFLWHPAPVDTVATLKGVAWADDEHAYAVGDRYVFAWDGAGWTEVLTAPGKLAGVWAAGPGDVWVVGEQGYVGHLVGSDWERVPVATTLRLNAVTAGPGGGPMIVGERGTVLVWRDAGFELEAGPTARELFAVAQSDEGLVYVAGARGALLSYDGSEWRDLSLPEHRSTLFAVGAVAGKAFAMGAHEVVLGPMLAIPTNLSPADGELFDDRLSWTVNEEVSPDFSVLDFGSAAGPCSACGAMFVIPYSEWIAILDGDLTTARFPRMSQMEPGGGMSFGIKDVTLYRVRVGAGFDFDDTANNGFFNVDWRSWATRSLTYFRF